MKRINKDETLKNGFLEKKLCVCTYLIPRYAKINHISDKNCASVFN